MPFECRFPRPGQLIARGGVSAPAQRRSLRGYLTPARPFKLASDRSHLSVAGRRLLLWDQRRMSIGKGATNEDLPGIATGELS